MSSACFILAKINGKLEYYDLGGDGNRHPAAMILLEYANSIYKWDDFQPILVQTDDNYHKLIIPGINKYCSYTKTNSFINLIPDFLFTDTSILRHNTYNDAIFAIYNASLQTPSIFKVGWIGQVIVPTRQLMYKVGEICPLLFDFLDSKTAPFMSLAELVSKYPILIDVEGAGYSTRLKLLLWSHRPLILIDRPVKEYYEEYLVPWEHYIPVKRDMSDLIEKTVWIFENYDKAIVIANNAFILATKYTTIDAAAAQWNKVITGTESGI
jgi:Glycosyl transferase family 90